MLSETFVSLPYNKLFHFDIFVKQKQKAYSCFSLLNQWKNLCQLIAWILSNSNCLYLDFPNMTTPNVNRKSTESSK